MDIKEPITGRLKGLYWEEIEDIKERITGRLKGLYWEEIEDIRKVKVIKNI